MPKHDQSFHENSLFVDNSKRVATKVQDGLSHPVGDNALARFALPSEKEASDEVPCPLI